MADPALRPLLDRAAWLAFIGLTPILCASGAWLFLRSTLPRRKKIAWALFLVACGIPIGLVLPLPGIRNRFLLLLAAMPVLAAVDVLLARSTRSFLFWFRACAFEVTTVFGCAAVTRYLLDLR